MNGQALIDSIMDKIQDPAYGRSWFLEQLNHGMRYLAGRLLLPGLADGIDTVTTLTNANIVAMPDDYHRELFLAYRGTTPLKRYANAGLMRDAGFDLDLTTGSVCAITVLSGKLLYQYVPAAATVITLRYYRAPAPLLDADDSFPDGLAGYLQAEDLFNRALQHYVYREFYSLHEIGAPNTDKVDRNASGWHEIQLNQLISTMDFKMSPAGPRKEPPVCGVQW